MDSILSCFGASFGGIVRSSIGPLGRQIGYIVHCKRNVGDLKKKVEELERWRSDVNRLVKGARRRGEVIKEVVEAWLAEVATISNEDDGLDKINRWFKGWCCSRYHLGKQAKKKIGIVDRLLDQGKSFSSVSDPASSSTIEFIPAGDFQEFSSRKSATEEVIEALKNETKNVVGVYGTGGVGKTTLMKQIANKVKRDQLFDEFVMVTVPQNPDVKKIQNEIALQFSGKKIEEDYVDAGAWQLSKRLKGVNRVLVILDNLWKRLDLKELGIPYGDDHKGCKVVLTTRSEGVCHDMETQANIKLELLDEEDSWNLFRQKAGDVVDSLNSQTVARKIVAKCGGLPVAIVTVGRAMRNRVQESLWQNALRELERHTLQGMSDVYSSINLSYDYLESEEIKKCFLYCCLFPENYNISDRHLMPYVMGEGVFEHVYTLEEAKNKLQAVLKKLIESCLLEQIDENENGFVTRMHDVVRNAAIPLITNKEVNGCIIVKAGSKRVQWQDRGKLMKCIRMSLMEAEISELPDEPECPMLLSLSLLKNGSLEIIPDKFFARMTSLLILDLKKTEISSLPPSLSNLENLQVLRLDGTRLSDVSLVVKLKKLKILGLRGTQIQRLPEEMKELTNLRSLDLSRNSNLEIIPQNVLSNLTLLEELQMLKSFSGWEIDETGDRGNKAKLVELASLSSLTKLSFDVDNVNCLSKYIPICTEKLKYFYIRVGEKRYYNRMQLKSMILTTPSDPLSNWAKALLKRTVQLHLFSCRDLKNVVELDAGEFKDLKFLRIEECHEMEYLTSVVEISYSETAFSDLERLEISNMKGLKALYQEPLTYEFLEKLKYLTADNCPKMTNVVVGDLVERLQNLEIIDVVNCEELTEIFQSERQVELTEIFQSERQVEGHAMMPRLRSIYLRQLPKLKTIWNVATSFPLIFPNLVQVHIENCKSMRHLFPMKVVRGFQQLRLLHVEGCDEMEEIFVDDDEEANYVEEYKKILPQLESLRLQQLPKLSRFSQQGLFFDWPSLKYLHLKQCPNLKKLPLGSQSALILKKIVGDNVEWFEGLEWEDQSIKSRLQPLFVEVKDPNPCRIS